MGLTEPSIYLDSCLAIYLVEEHPSFVARIEDALATSPNLLLCISTLTEMECLIAPFRAKNKLLISKFENWFQTVDILPLENEIFRNAAQLRADFSSLRTPDALHIATALHHSCTEFWTNDHRLNAVAPSLVKNILIG